MFYWFCFITLLFKFCTLFASIYVLLLLQLILNLKNCSFVVLLKTTNTFVSFKPLQDVTKINFNLFTQQEFKKKYSFGLQTFREPPLTPPPT